MLHQAVYQRSLWDGAVDVIVYGATRDWRFAGITREEVEASNPGVTGDVLDILHTFGIRRALMPKPAFNARVVDAADLPTEVVPGVFRGTDADGVFIQRSGDAYLLGSADCLTAVVYDPYRQQLLGLHCGRDALVDRGRLKGGPARQHESVVNAGIQQLAIHGNFRPWAWKVFLAAGIGPDSFTHPTTETVPDSDGNPVENKYCEVNRALMRRLEQFDASVGYREELERSVVDFEHGKISLVGLVKAQLVSNTVKLANIGWDGCDTATDTDAQGNFLYHSNRRDRMKRNLVVVKLN